LDVFGSVVFLTETEEGVDQFIREYVLDAIDRVDELGICEGISFDRDEQLNPDGGSVVLMVASDFEVFVEHERDRWEEFSEADVIDDWKTKQITKEQIESRFGERGSKLARRLLPLSGQMGKLAYEEFDDEHIPPANEAYPEEESAMSVGWWFVPHHMTVGNLGYSPRQEIRMQRSMFDENLRLIAEREGAEAVDAEIDDFIDALEEMREDVKEGRPGS
jgi:hypothetical protein